MKVAPFIAILAIVSSAVAGTTSANARGSSCDGIHRCRCGSTQARHFGFPRFVNGHNLWRAIEWKYAFSHTSFRSGAVGVENHHVYRVLEVTGPNRATVSDDAGQHERRIKPGTVFVDPNGNSVAKTEPTIRSDYSARRHSRKHQRSYAQTQVASVDRLTAH